MSDRTASLRIAARAAALVAVATLALGAAVRADEVVRWNRVATDAAAAAGTDPLTESRWFAILQLAVHDALNAVEPRYESYRRHDVNPSGASPEAAIAGAAHEAMSRLMPAAQAAFDAALAESLAAVPDGDAERRGVALGRAVAQDLLRERADDGADRTVEYTAGAEPGAYRPTPPNFEPAFVPQWGGIRPFALATSDQYRPAPPPPVGSPQALAEIAEVRRFGSVEAGDRTEEQTEIAKYWYENSSQGWNRVARVVAESRRLDPWQSARLLALVNVAMADGFIGGFEAKYHYKYWRPATAIREAGEKEWLPHLWTPPVPDHPSTHTVLGAAAAAAIADVLGTDFVPFEMTSGAPYAGITRRFWSLSQAARENGASRVFAGIHFASAVREGYLQGERIGHHACGAILRPLGAPAAAGGVTAASMKQ